MCYDVRAAADQTLCHGIHPAVVLGSTLKAPAPRLASRHAVREPTQRGFVIAKTAYSYGSSLGQNERTNRRLRDDLP